MPSSFKPLLIPAKAVPFSYCRVKSLVMQCGSFRAAISQEPFSVIQATLAFFSSKRVANGSGFVVSASIL